MRLIFATGFLLLLSTLSAQDFNLQELRSATGSWEGALTYRDYSSDKRVKIPINLTVALDPKNFDLIYRYPDEPHADNKSRMRLRKGGTYFGKEKIESFDQNAKEKKLVTTSLGSDNGKKAKFFHTYIWSSQYLLMRKEVRYIGETERNFRNEYEFRR